MHEPHFHVGILVRDLDTATETFSAKLGLEFEPVRTGTVLSGETTRFRYSIQGPPYIELVEMTGSGTWSADLGEGLHHIGIADADIPGRCAVFNDRALPVLQAANGTPQVVFTDAEELHGVRIEYLQTEVVSRLVAGLQAMRCG